MKLACCIVAASLTLVSACAATPAPPVASASAADAASPDAANACPVASRIPAGGCCPKGTVLVATPSTCQAIGPRGCTAESTEGVTACLPRWCGDYRDSAGEYCAAGEPGCHAVGRACSDAEWASGAGCPAGSQVLATGCVPAGLSSQHTEATEATDNVPTLVGPPEAPTLQPLPSPAKQTFCWSTALASLVPCPADLAQCPPGKLPDPAAPQTCIDLGVPWLCPPGFVANAGSDGLEAPCLPDPADCGDPPFGAVLPGPSMVYLDPKAPAGGNGSAQAPFNTIGDAAQGTPQGATLVLAAGTYPPFGLNVPIHIHGRCAALVTIQSAPTQPSLVVTAGTAASPLQLQGITLAGPYFGLIVKNKGNVTAKRLFVRKATVAALFVQGTDSALSVMDSAVAATQNDGKNKGYGATADTGGQLSLQDVRIDGSFVIGAGAVGNGTVATLLRVAVLGTTEPDDKTLAFGQGLLAADGGSVTGTSVLLRSNQSVSVNAAGGNAVIALVGALILDTVPSLAKNEGGAVGARTGGKVMLHGARISGCSHFGLGCVDAPSVIDARGTVVDNVVESTTKGSGHGVSAAYGGSVALTGVRVSKATNAGIVAGVNGLLVARGVLVDGTRPTPVTLGDGVGINVETGSVATLAQVRVSGSRLLGLRAVAKGTRVDAVNLLIDGTLAREKDNIFGLGILVANGAVMDLSSARLHGNREAGALVIGVGARLRAHGVLVDTQVGIGKELVSFGMGALEGGQLQLAGSRFAHSRGRGVVGYGPKDTRLQIYGIDVLGAADSAFTFGNGVDVGAGVQQADIVASRFRNCRTAGLSFHEAKGTISDCAVLNTQAGIYQPLDLDKEPVGAKITLADAIIATSGAVVQVSHSFAWAQSRAGVLVRDSKVTMASSLFGGGQFGIADLGNATILQQAVVLRGNQTAQISDKGLPVPQPPVLELGTF